MRRLRDQTFGNQLSLKKHSVSQKSVQANKEFIYPGLPHCRRILYQLSHKGSPRILEWVSRYPVSSGYLEASPADLSDPGIELGTPALHVDSLPTEVPGKPIYIYVCIHTHTHREKYTHSQIINHHCVYALSRV